MNPFNAKLRLGAIIGILAVAVPAAALGTYTPAVRASGTAIPVQLNNVGTVNLPAGGLTAATITTSEFAPTGADSDAATHPISIDRTLGPSKGQAPGAANTGRTKPDGSLVQSFDGLNLFQERYAQPGGNFQFEPPDQSLCAGNGYVVDGVNDAMSVYSQSTGARVAGPTTLNSFLGFSQELNRGTGVYGPETTDPTCYFDASTGRFFYVVLTLDVASNGLWYGGNEIDIAVSNSNNPTGSWTVYHLDVTGDGASGCPCLGDYPHIGADANGIYVTTNDFPLVTNGYNGSQIYAFSKRGLETGTNLNGWRFDTSTPGFTVGTDSGFTVWPATSPGGQFATDANGTEYFLSSTFDNCASCTISDNRIAVWALANTSNLSGPNPPSLSNTTVVVGPYTDPPAVSQKNGSLPYGQTYYGATSAGVITANDARNLSAVYANGELWGALNTGAIVNGVSHVGIGYYVIKPSVSKGTVKASVGAEGTLASANTDLIFPSIGMTTGGHGVITYTLTGPDDFPSAAYSTLDDKNGAGPITIAASGVGPSDGFSEYQPYFDDGSPRPRWGDYGAASVDGNNIWIASEYIGQSCTQAQYAADFTCGQTRGSAANWDTRISELNLHP